MYWYCLLDRMFSFSSVYSAGLDYYHGQWVVSKKICNCVPRPITFLSCGLCFSLRFIIYFVGFNGAKFRYKGVLNTIVDNSHFISYFIYDFKLTFSLINCAAKYMRILTSIWTNKSYSKYSRISITRTRAYSAYFLLIWNLPRQLEFWLL